MPCCGVFCEGRHLSGHFLFFASLISPPEKLILLSMKTKKIVTNIIVIIVALGMVASYVFSGFAPRQTASPAESVTSSDFQGPVGEPFVNGPPTPPALK
jgi:hypothetical protein